MSLIERYSKLSHDSKDFGEEDVILISVGYVSFMCPCNEGGMRRLPIKSGAKKGWDVKEVDGKVTISPSIRDVACCKCHFFIRENRVDWCSDSPCLKQVENE